MTTAGKLKWLIFLSMGVMFLIVAFQNIAETEVRVLFWKGTLPQAAVLAVAALVGFVMGIFAKTLWKVRAWRRIRHRAMPE